MKYRNYIHVDFNKIKNSEWDWFVGLFFVDGSIRKNKDNIEFISIYRPKRMEIYWKSY